MSINNKINSVIAIFACATFLLSGWIILGSEPVIANSISKCSTECPNGKKLTCEGSKCETKNTGEYEKDPVCIVDNEEFYRCSELEEKKKEKKKTKKNENPNNTNANQQID